MVKTTCTRVSASTSGRISSIQAVVVRVRATTSTYRCVGMERHRFSPSGTCDHSASGNAASITLYKLTPLGNRDEADALRVEVTVSHR